jgi:multicomponent K+:H+ antiporter subunit C
MEWLLASAVGVLGACGVYLMLRARSFDLVLGMTLLSYAVNLFLFLAGGMAVGRAPILRPGAVAYADPLPQALVLTAIVIGLAMTALLLVLALRAHAETGGDHVDGGQRTPPREQP